MRWISSIRRGVAIGSVVMLAATSAAACSSSVSSRSDAAVVTGVSDGMLTDAARYQAPGGLFFLPETGAVTATNFTAVAHYVPIDKIGADVIDWEKAAANPLPESADIAEADAYLQVQNAAGVTRLDPETLSRLQALLIPPPAQSDSGAEIGALWTWSDGVARLRAMGLAGDFDPAGTARVKAVPLADVSGHPYLVQRLSEVYDHVGLTPSKQLVTMSSQLATQKLETPDLTSLAAVLDTSAVVAARAAAGMPTGLSTQDLADLEQLTQGSGQGDDLLRAAVLQIAAMSGATDLLAGLTAPLAERVDSTTGLLDAATGQVGTVEAAYLFSRLLDLRFAEIATAQTRDALAEAAADEQQSLPLRLQAVAALKRAGDDRWEGFQGLAAQASTDQPGHVGEPDLPAYLEVMEPAVQVSPDVSLATLQDFNPGSDDTAQRQAWAALRLNYLFANQSEVSAMFPELQREMKGWVDDPSTPFPQLLAAAAILPSSKVVDVDSTYLDQLGARIAGHRGCSGSSTFFALDGSADGLCSVILTLQARGVPGGTR